MKFAIANPAAWNRWISPYQFTPVKIGSTFRLIWTLNNAHEYKATVFNLVIRKGSSNSNVPSGNTALNQEEYLRPRIGSQWFDQVSTEQALAITPTADSSDESVHQASRFEHDITFSGAGVGDTVMVSVSWTDRFGNTHTMYAPPFLLEGATASNAAAAAGENPTTASPLEGETAPALGTEGVPLVNQTAAAAPRRLDFDFGKTFQHFFHNAEEGWQKGENGEWTHSLRGGTAWDADRQCAQKDLNFAFGAGIMFRAYVKHLSLPSDLPILGALQRAPELGTPWQLITGWMSSPTDLASKLPALLCRHGVCSATLPGCPQFSDVKHYYPEITVQFKHTLRYPHETADAKDQWIAALKTGLSYTFAIMPEAITMIVHYANLTNIPPVLPGGGGAVVNPTSSHRRRYTQFHNVMTGEDSCENRGYNNAQCMEVGCCTWDGACHSAVGNGPCYKNGIPATGPTVAPTVGPTVAATGPTGSTASPVTLPPTAAPEQSGPFSELPATTVQPGPVIAPLIGGGRRLDNDVEDDDEETGTHVYGISIQFKDGLRYEVDEKLIDEMYREGLFKTFEEVPSGDNPLRIHSYAIRDMNDELSQKYSLSEKVGAVIKSPQQILVLSAFAGCALMGVAFVVRRVRTGYRRVEEASGPVE